MTLPASGQISASMINVELGRASNHLFKFGGGLSDESILGGRGGGLKIKFSNFHGKTKPLREPESGYNYDVEAFHWRLEHNLLEDTKYFKIVWDGAVRTSNSRYTNAQNLFNAIYITVVGKWSYYGSDTIYEFVHNDIHYRDRPLFRVRQ